MGNSQRVILSSERRVLLVFVASALLGILLVSGTLWFFLQRAALAQTQINLKGRAGVLALLCENEIEEARQDLEFLSTLPAFQQLPYVDRIDRAINGVPENVDVEKRQILAQFMNTTRRFSVLQVVRPNGDIYLRHPFRVQSAVKKSNLSDRPYYQEAVRTKSTVVSDSFVGSQGVPVVVIFVPIFAESGEVTKW